MTMDLNPMGLRVLVTAGPRAWAARLSASFASSGPGCSRPRVHGRTQGRTTPSSPPTSRRSKVAPPSHRPSRTAWGEWMSSSMCWAVLRRRRAASPPSTIPRGTRSSTSICSPPCGWIGHSCRGCSPRARVSSFTSHRSRIGFPCRSPRARMRRRKRRSLLTARVFRRKWHRRGCASFVFRPDGSRPRLRSPWPNGLPLRPAPTMRAASRSSWIRWAAFRSGARPSRSKSRASSHFSRRRARRRSPERNHRGPRRGSVAGSTYQVDEGPIPVIWTITGSSRVSAKCVRLAGSV
jgi:hypothetical protein